MPNMMRAGTLAILFSQQAWASPSGLRGSNASASSTTDATKLPLAGGKITGSVEFASAPLVLNGAGASLTVVGANFSVGTSTLVVANGMVAVATNTANPPSNYSFAVGGGSLAVTTSGHVVMNGKLPTLTLCGSGTINANSNDMRGSVTFAGGAQSACTVNFANAGGLATPFCTCSDDAAVTAVDCAPGVGTLTVSITVAANDTISYMCQW